MRRFVATCAVVVTGAFGAPAAMATGGISGHVTDIDGNPLSEICVRANAPNAVDPFVVPFASTNALGAYTIDGLSPGNYTVVFTDESAHCPTGTDFYFTQWFDAQTDQGSADLVAVADGVTTPGVDAVMVEPSGVGGRVTDSTGHGIADMCVTVLTPENATNTNLPPAGFAQTDADGYYFAPVDAGQYKVHFYDNGIPCDQDKYEQQWFNDKPDAGSADLVQVSVNRARFDIDAVMYQRSSISGHAQDEAGQPIAGLCVVANKAHVLNPPGLIPPFAQTDAAGNYVMDIQPGDWVLQFYDGAIPCTSTSNWQLQYYSGKYIFDDADVIHVERGARVAGINVTMRPKPPPAPPPPVIAPPPARPSVTCHVPKLRGKTLRRAKRLLHRNHCGVGKIRRRATGRQMAGRVLASKPRARSVRPAGTKVALVVGKRR
jgi:PASTA domain-containing protein